LRQQLPQLRRRVLGVQGVCDRQDRALLIRRAFGVAASASARSPSADAIGATNDSGV
jgi:hypothetical protein